MDITYISFETLKKSSNQESYGDDYIFITNNLDNIFLGNKSVKLDVFIMIFCAQGFINIESNNCMWKLQRSDMMLNMPNTIIRRIYESDDAQFKIFCFSTRFLRRMLHADKDSWRAIRFMQLNPVGHLCLEDNELLDIYFSLIDRKTRSMTDKCQTDIMLCIASALFGELLSNLKMMADKLTDGKDDLINQTNFIFKHFMESLAEDNGRHRTLEYYAGILGYSAKYLSKAIKKASGKNALEIINGNAVEHIIIELKYSNKSIKEIAIDFEFPNISFFSQYLKKHLGMTPSEFRSNNQSYRTK